MTRNSKHPKGPKIALAATVLAAPIVTAAPAAAQRATPSPGPARSAPRLRLILGPMLKNATSRYTVAGMIDGHTVFRDATGRLFYLDPKTGDAHLLARAAAFKHLAPGSAAYPIEHGHVPVTLLGVDARGHTLMRTAGGETFYLDAKTGDMVDVR